MANIKGVGDWSKFTVGTPFHTCGGCQRQLAPFQGKYCEECERWSLASGKPPLSADLCNDAPLE